MSSVTGPSELTLAELNEMPEPAARQALASCCTAMSWIDAIVGGRGYSSVDELLAQSDAAVADLTPDQLGEALAGHPRIGDRRAASAGWSRQEQAGVYAAGTGSADAGSAGAGSAGGRSADAATRLAGSAGAGLAGAGSAGAGLAGAGSAGAGSAGGGLAGAGSAGGGLADAATRLAEALAEGNAEYERRFGHIYLVCATGKSGEELLAILRERLGNDRDTEWKVVAAELAKINQIRLRKLLGAQP